MKKTNSTQNRSQADKLSLRSETIRILTERELFLVAAGNCVKASMDSQNSTTYLNGVC